MPNLPRRAEGEITITLTIVLVLGLIIGCLTGCPSYSVYLKDKEGQGDLMKAESTRRVAVLEAQAKLDSAKMLAEAEVARARGVAQANEIIGKSLENNELYLHYLWINNLHEGRNDVIYVPTEAGIPLMEAGTRERRVKAPQQTPAH